MATSSIGSGGMIDVNSIVSQLMSIERNPLTLINNQIKGIDTKLSEVGKLKAAMDKLRSAAVSLSGAGSWSAAKASSARPEVVEASAAAGALPGSYSLRVDALAQHQTLVTGPVAGSDALVGGGSLTITFGSGEGGGFVADGGRAPVQILVPAGASLAEVRDAINGANAGVGATLVTDAAGTRLMIRSAESGEAQAFRIDAADDGSGASGLGLGSLAYTPGDTGGSMTRLQTATNAQVEFNGLAVSLASNNTSDLIENVSFGFRQVSADPVAIEIGNDGEAVRSGLESFVDAYNELNSLIRTQTAYDPATRTAGALQGNQTVNAMQSKLRAIMGATVEGIDLGRLSDAGIEIQRDGSLKIADDKLSTALADPKKLQELFSSNDIEGGVLGIGRQVGNLLDDLLGIDGAISGATESLKARREIYENREERLQSRLTLIEARLIRQYSALDASLSQLNGSLSALSNLPTE
ncbi:MAG: flagellar filament capping protein FliD [Burkholderiaceae bacterium]|nr:flagellar filament capping protein FliD [Burkholderiaceae bacterium]MEB2317816.1 flagellar filament capping protein FliD [Pseudomonadota bacterium]